MEMDTKKITQEPYDKADLDEAARTRLTEWLSAKAQRSVEVHFLPEAPVVEENEAT